MKTIKLNDEQVRLTRIALRECIAMWIDHNTTIQMHGTDEQINELVKKNNERIEQLYQVLDQLND